MPDTTAIGRGCFGTIALLSAQHDPTQYLLFPSPPPPPRLLLFHPSSKSKPQSPHLVLPSGSLLSHHQLINHNLPLMDILSPLRPRPTMKHPHPAMDQFYRRLSLINHSAIQRTKGPYESQPLPPKGPSIPIPAALAEELYSSFPPLQSQPPFPHSLEAKRGKNK